MKPTAAASAVVLSYTLHTTLSSSRVKRGASLTAQSRRMPSALRVASTYRTHHAIPRGRSRHDGGGDGPTKDGNPDVCFYFCFTSPTTTVRNKPFPVLTNQRKTTARRHLLAGTQRSPQACRQNTNSTPYGIRWKCLEVLFGLTRQLRAPRPPP